MEFQKLLEVIGDEPVFETGLLLAGQVDPGNIRRQITRWTDTGRLYQLRRGLYALAPPFQKVKPHPFLIANRMVHGSYVSKQSALAHHGLIPEHVPKVVSVTSARPRQWHTPLGSFLFQHIKVDYLHGYQTVALGGQQSALVARPEKALLDLVYFTPGGDEEEYLRSLRLQNLDAVERSALQEAAATFDRPKLWRAVEVVSRLRCEELSEAEAP